MNGSRSMEESGGQVELPAAVGSVCRGTRTLGRDCVQCERIWISMDAGIQPNRTQPSATGCWSGLAVRVRIVRHPSFLGPSPSHNHSACVRIYCARAVSQDGKGLDLSLSPTSLCIPLPCVACPESTALHTAGHPQPHERFWEAQPLTTPHTPDPAAVLPFHLPTTVLLSHIIPSMTSLNNSTATTEILWIY